MKSYNEDTRTVIFVESYSVLTGLVAGMLNRSGSVFIIQLQNLER